MKKSQLLLVLLLYCFAALSQDLGSIGKQKPVTVSGSVGASTAFYNSNEPVASRPSFSWNLYGNVTPVVYGVALPFSFVVNQYSKSYTQPFTQFGLSPTYRWIKLHLGYRTLQLSPLTFDGQSFRGAGLELNPGLLRFGAFYGKLNRRINEDTSSGRFTSPQFSRMGYGARIGVGNTSNYIDLIYFHARDDSSSATVINKNNYRPQENTVLGTSFKLTLYRRLLFTTDVAISGFTQDIAAPQDSSSAGGAALQKLMKPFVRSNTSTVANWAAQSTVQLLFKGYTTTLGYRRVQPGFKSLGTPYMLNDVELFNWLNNIIAAKGKLTITTSLSHQHNNLDHQLASALQTLTGNINVNAALSTHLNLNANYTGYNMQQRDGTEHIKDSAKLHQFIHQFSITPSYTIISAVRSHTVSGNVNYMLLKDFNVVTAPFTSSNNLAVSLNYTMGFIQHGSSITCSGLFSQYKQDTNYYKTYGATIGGSAQVLKSKQLSLQGTAGYLFNRSSYGNVQHNLTFSGNAGYHIQHHSFSAFANYVYTPYNPINNLINKNIPQAVATKNLAGGVSYNYSF